MVFWVSTIFIISAVERSAEKEEAVPVITKQDNMAERIKRDCAEVYT